jgi:hypothetical protein
MIFLEYSENAHLTACTGTYVYIPFPNGSMNTYHMRGASRLKYGIADSSYFHDQFCNYV